MFTTYTAKYTKIDSGYMGQLIEWAEIVTEGKDIEECRYMLRDALNEMILAYQQQGKEIPIGNSLIEQVPVEVDSVHQTAWPYKSQPNAINQTAENVAVLTEKLVGGGIACAIAMREKVLKDQILICSETYEAVKDFFKIEKMNNLNIKGTGEGRAIYNVIDTL